MRLQSSFDAVVAEKIVELVLLRTGLVSIIKDSSNGSDLSIHQIEDNKNKISVKVIVTNKKPEEILKEHKSLISDLSKISNHKPHIIFFINAQSQSGYFTILSNLNERKLHKLRMDLLSIEISTYYGSLKDMEFPPYFFFQKERKSKYKTRSIPLDSKFNVVRLYNLSLNPIEKKNSFSLEIQIKQGIEKKTLKFNLAKQFYNPNLKQYLFFVNQDTGEEFTDIPLPQGRKDLIFRIESLIDSDFEIRLACEYLTGYEEKMSKWARKLI
jgi:hypothetical protein